jgi:magnesium-transporting ATPase (P-type)
MKIGDEEWHSIGVTEALEKLETDPERGLSEDEVIRRLSVFGSNELQKEKHISPVSI